MPKFTFDTIDPIPEDLRSAAVKDENDKYVLDLSPTSKVKEFRDSNNTLKGQIENLQSFRETVSQLAGFEKPDEFDMEKFREDLGGLREIKGQVEAGKLIADSSLEAAVEERLKEAKGGYEKQKNELSRKITDTEKARQATQERLHSYVIESEITRAVMAGDSDIRGDALPDILNRARGTFKVDPEKLTVAPYDPEGQPIYGGEDPTKTMSTKEWLANQVQSSPYLSKSSKGGGAEGGGKGGGGPVTSGAGVKPVRDYFAERKAELAAEHKAQRQ